MSVVAAETLPWIIALFPIRWTLPSGAFVVLGSTEGWQLGVVLGGWWTGREDEYIIYPSSPKKQKTTTEGL